MMLSRIRKNTKLILWILLALIVPPFLFFGIESVFVSKGDPVVGILFGKKILKSDFWKARTFAATMISLQRQGELNPMILDQLAWQRMILLKQAKDAGLEVTDHELSKAILRNFSEGQFDRKSYEIFIQRSLRLSVFEFEKAYRETLLIQKFQETLAKLVQVSNDEVYEMFLRENEKLKVSYCEIPFYPFIKDIQASVAEIKKFYEQNQKSFQVDAQRKLRYIAIPLEGFKVNANISQKKIENYYRKHQKEFDKPLNNNDVSGEIQDKLQLQKAKAMARKLSGQMYHELLDGKSLKATSQKYGYSIQETPLFLKSSLPSPFDVKPEWGEKFFKSKLKKPLESLYIEKTFYIVVPWIQRKSFVPGLEEIREKVEERVIEEKAREMAKVQAQKIRDQVEKLVLDERLSFAEALKKAGQKPLELAPFSRKDARLEFDPIKRMSMAAAQGQISSLVPTQKGDVFFMVLESLKPDEKEFHPQKAELQQKALLEKRQKIFYEYDNWLLKQCKFLQTAKMDEES